MCRLYSVLRALAQRWFWFVLALVGASFVFGMIGFAKMDPQYTSLTDAYLVILLFGLNCTQVTRNVGWELEIARWLGFAVWFLTIAAILIRIFSEHWLVLYVAVCARLRGGHVVVAGLGTTEAERDRLVEKMRRQGKDVVVLEANPAHPGLDACRQAGAVCLIGSPYEPAMMRKAQLTRAGSLLCLCEDDRKNVTLLSLAAEVAGGGKPAVVADEEDPLVPPHPDDIGVVVQVSEPRLLEVLRRHDLHHNSADRLHVRIFSMHEMVARAMLRECLIGVNRLALNRILLVGTGTEGRLGETLVLRAIKDRWIDAPPRQPVEPLEIHVHDEKASAWAHCVKSSMGEELAQICRLEPFDCPGGRWDSCDMGQRKKLAHTDYDAVFVCPGHEPHALIQAAQLREILPEKIRIIVRVREEESGFGALLNRPGGGGLGWNLRVVGSHSRVFDVAASMNPMVEMIAQVLHQDYLSINQRMYLEALAAGDHGRAERIHAKKAFVSWRQLPVDLKDSNRLLAQRLRKHLTVPGSRRQFKLKFSPHGLLAPANMFLLTANELEGLASQEHNEWMAAMLALGWRRGTGKDPHSSDPMRKLNPNLVPWEQLDEVAKAYDRNIIHRLPYVFAKADYQVLEMDNGH